MLRCRSLIHIFIYMPVTNRNWERFIAVYDAWSQGWVTNPIYPSVRLFQAQCKYLVITILQISNCTN